ncbi:hypothetical protein [Nocardia acidivorans]|uniref:hypothetical protein n=1 Tax=Nocardia acidivorans TaxID=404580 RepID=UPI000830D4B6|nr:hypothetical protein [Nocardia acidivorans]
MAIRTHLSAALLAAAVLPAALAISAPGAAAAPAPIGYTATADGQRTILSTDSGSLGVENGVLQVRSTEGRIVGGTELSFRVDDYVFPITAEIKDRTAVLTPRFDTEHAVYRPVALPFEESAPWRTPYEREQAAWTRMTSTIAMGASVGTLVGGLGGAAVGCLVGGAVGATLTGALTAMFGALPAGIVGCVAGVAAIGVLGTVAGQLLVTAPVAIAAAIQYFTTVNSPFPGK